jgi:sensor histidine kinase YesM
MVILLVAGVFIAIIGIIVSIMYYVFDSAEADIISVYYIFLPGTIIETSLFTAGLIYKAYSSVRIRNKLELEKFELEKINSFHQKQVIQNELKALRAQINPHFIQNTFDLIAQRIWENDKEESVRIIRKVSAYFRQILLKSETSMISLEDEVEYTENYLKIQQLVHPGLFSYIIQMPESVDSFGIQMPAMLLQPIAENCIKHGFKNIRKGGKIIIDIEEKDGILKIVFTDNGRALTREKTEEQLSQSTVVVLTKKRINLMLENNHEKVSVRLYSEAENTIFEIQYPCIF